MELTGLFFYIVSLLILGGIYALLCLALNVQWGMGGLFNAGIAGFYGVGAYTSAILTTAASAGTWRLFHARPDRPCRGGDRRRRDRLGGCPICVRLKSDYLAMASIGIAEILRLVFVNESWLTNGSLGVSRIPRPFADFTTGRMSDVAFLGFVWVIVLLVYVATTRLYDSPWGRSLRAIRDNETSASAAGKNVEKFRIQTFVIGCAVMGIAGGLSAHYFRFLSPTATDPLLTTFLVWVMLMAGGSGNNRGAILGALTIWTIWSVTEIFTNRLPPEWATRVPSSVCFWSACCFRSCCSGSGPASCRKNRRASGSEKIERRKSVKDNGAPLRSGPFADCLCSVGGLPLTRCS